MQYKSTCPGCSIEQTRWDFFEPFPGFINKCRHCGNEYTSDKKSIILGLIIGVIIAVLLILADKNILSWSIVLPFILLVFITAAYGSPYITKLVAIAGKDKDINGAWLKPYIRWQILISIFVLALLGLNLYAYKYNEFVKEKYCCLSSKIEKVNSTDKLKEIAIIENDVLTDNIDIYKKLIEANITAMIFLVIFLSFNYLFYLKLKHSHNQRLKNDAQKTRAS